MVPNPWYIAASEDYRMTGEQKAPDYQALLGEYIKNQEELAVLRMRFKRIGQCFVSLGNSLMLNPTAAALDNPSFLADTVNLWDMLQRHDDLSREQAEKKIQLNRLQRSKVTSDR